MNRLDNPNLFSGEKPYEYQLPTSPCPDVGTVLVTGASGYVGGRLIPALLQRGYRVRAMVRTPSPQLKQQWPGLEVVEADAMDPDGLDPVLRNIHTAYYLIHSLALGPEHFDVADINAAANFRDAAARQGVQRIIYLGGLGDLSPGLSDHLASRIKVALTLGAGPVPVTALRAAVIIGSGSASYEIIHSLVKRLRFLPAPRSAWNLCQPIAIRDVMKYLIGVLEAPETTGHSYDIGGPDIMTYREMMIELGHLLNRRIRVFRFPVKAIPPYAYIASLVTPVPAPIIAALMEGLRNDVTCRDFAIHDAVPIKPIRYREALLRAMDREEQDAVRTRWSDAWPPVHELAIRLNEMRKRPRFTAKYELITEKSAERLFESVCRVGGKEGWFHTNWLWRLRGFLDRMLGGVGGQRGRRSHRSLKTGDVIDFWRVEELEENARLLLRAEMKLPGRAWLEFRISTHDENRKLTIMAYYHTRTLFGLLYWYLLVPFHRIVFRDLIHGIADRA